MDLEGNLDMVRENTILIYDRLRHESEQERIEMVNMYIEGNYTILKKDDRRSLEQAIRLTISDFSEETRLSILYKNIDSNTQRIAHIIDCFEITKPKIQEDIAMRIIRNDGPICNNIHRLNIKDEALRAKIAKEAVRKGMSMVPSFIERFEITNQKDLMDIARMLVYKNGKRLARNFSKFGIQSEQDRIDIAYKLMKVSGKDLSENIEQFNIHNEDERLAIAKELTRKVPGSVAENIARFKIDDKEKRFDLAKRIAQHANGRLSLYIKEFDIPKEEQRKELAIMVAHINSKDMAIHIQNYQIEDKGMLLEILKETVMTDKKCLRLLLGLKQYKLTELEDVKYVFNMIISHESDLNEMTIKLGKYKKCLEDMLNDAKGFSFKKLLKRKACVGLIKNIDKLGEFYIAKLEGKNKVNYDMGEILGGSNARRIEDILNSQDGRAKEQSIEIIEKIMFTKESINAKLKEKDELTKLIEEIITIRSLKLKEMVVPLSIRLINEGKLYRITDEMEINNKKKAYPAIFTVIFDKLSLYEEGAEDTLYRLREVFSISNVLRDSKVLQDTLIALNLLDGTYLSKEQIRNVIKCMVKVPSKIKVENKYISSIIYLNRVDKLENIREDQPGGIRGIFYDIYKEYLKIDDKLFMDKYEAFVKKPGNVARDLEEYIMIYVSRKNHDAKLMKSTRRFLETMSDITEFRKERYNKDNSKHLLAIKQISEKSVDDLYNKWTSGIEIDNMYKSMGSPFELDEGMEKIHEKYNYNKCQYLKNNQAVITDDPVDLFLIGTEVEGSCQSVTYNGDFSSCLMGYVMDGKNKAVVIKNDKGKIAARCMIRLLIDKDTNEAILVREKLYRAVGIEDDVIEKLNQRCEDYAKWLGVSLLCEDRNAIDKERYNGTLLSKKCNVPYEYVDIARGRVLDDEDYTVTNGNLVYLYNNKERD